MRKMKTWIWTHTLCLWRGHQLHDVEGTPQQTRGYSLQQSVGVWNAGPPDLYNSHSVGCRVAFVVYADTETETTPLTIIHRFFSKIV